MERLVWHAILPPILGWRKTVACKPTRKVCESTIALELHGVHGPQVYQSWEVDLRRWELVLYS